MLLCPLGEEGRLWGRAGQRLRLPGQPPVSVAFNTVSKVGVGQRVGQRNITSLVGGGKIRRVYKLITLGFPGSSEGLLSNWLDQPPPPPAFLH